MSGIVDLLQIIIPFSVNDVRRETIQKCVHVSKIFNISHTIEIEKL